MYNPQIYTLIETVEAGSFAKAAERLHITPVSVMNQINALEARWGVKLFERTNRGVVLTAAGRSLCADAKRMIAESEAAVMRALAFLQTRRTSAVPLPAGEARGDRHA